MKPVLIVQHALTEGPGYLADFLDQQAIAWQLLRIDQGDMPPASIQSHSGLVLMGGPMSVNDDLPWIAPVLALIREAAMLDIPLLGHCLGGQLISKALGGSVGTNPVKEIGWGQVHLVDHDAGRHWFGAHQQFDVFHWHGETFTLPAGATLLLSSAHCPHQAYSLGKHVAFQCHIEMTADMVRSWCEVGSEEVEAASDSPGVQSIAAMQLDLPQRVFQLNQIAHGVYTQWIKGLPPG